MNFLTTLDGSGKSPREEQVDYLTHLSKVWSKHKYFVLNAAPGVGKSYLARTINRAIPSSAIVTPSNQLVDQYCATYLDLIALKGRDNYDSIDCHNLAKRMVTSGAPGVFNPISFFYHYLSNPDTKPDVVIIDEAHKLAELLVYVVSQQFHCDYYGVPSDLDDKGFLAWLETRCNKLALVKDRKASFGKQYEKLTLLHRYLKTNLKKVKLEYQDLPNYRTGVKERHLCVTPLVFPTTLLTEVFGEDTKIVFMSGTMYPRHMKELGLTEFDYKEYASACPMDLRRVHHVPVQDRTNVEALAAQIKAIRKSVEYPNTVIHVPYNQQKAYKAALGSLNVITHTKETKEQAITKFKRQGGILLASGMAEGVDLPGDYCRLIIVPKLLYPYLGDDAVKKRMTMPDGQTWYSMQTLVTTIQQLYRGVRGRDDWCNLIILDPTFPDLVQKMKKHLPSDFLRSIKWSA